jgi:hypothetical protein
MTNSMVQMEQSIMGSQTGRRDSMRFSFINQPLTNRYSLVKNYPEQKIISNEVPSLPQQVIPRVITTEFFKR